MKFDINNSLDEASKGDTVICFNLIKNRSRELLIIKNCDFSNVKQHFLYKHKKILITERKCTAIRMAQFAVDIKINPKSNEDYIRIYGHSNTVKD